MGPTARGAFALDAQTGGECWSILRPYIFAPKVLLDPDLAGYRRLCPATYRGDASKGEIRSTTDIGVRALNTGAAVHDGIAWIPGTTGQLTAVDIQTGTLAERLQLTATAFCFSTHVVAGGLLIVVDQDGTLHGLALE